MVRMTAVALSVALSTACAEPSRPIPPATESSEPSPAATTETAPRSEASVAGEQASGTDPLNVILIVIDSLRADVLGGDRAERVAPRLVELAGRGVDYRHAYSISSTTARSMPGLLAGKYPSAMVRNGYFFSHWYPENLFLSERLADAGFATLGAHAHAYFFPASGMSQGFTDHRVLPGTFLKNTTDKNVTSERLTQLAMSMLSQQKNVDQSTGKRFFAYIHYMDPHSPYLPHDGRPSFGTQPRDYYLQEVHYTDEWVGRLVDWVEKQPWGDRTATIITADHGECFGEHGHLKHGYELWQELVRVPLIFVAPGAKPRRISEPRGHIDLAPTILELMGRDVDPPLRGKSLVDELRGGKPKRRLVVMDLPRDNLQDRRRAIVYGRHKLIALGDDKAFLLYDVEADPREKKDLRKKQPELFEKMRARYEDVSRTIANVEYRGKEVQLRDAPPGRRY